MSPKKVKPEAGKVTLATIALTSFGKQYVTPEIVRQLQKALSKEEFAKLLSFSRTMPEWVQKSLEGVVFA